MGEQEAVVGSEMKKTLSGGKVKALTPDDLNDSLHAAPANIKIEGPGTVRLSDQAYEQLKSIARNKGLADAGYPQWVRLLVRSLPEATYLCMAPVGPEEGGVQMRRNDKRLHEAPWLSRLGAWFKRSGYPMASRVTRVSYTEIGTDADLGECLVVNLTTAEPLPAGVRKRRGEPAAPATGTPGGAAGSGPATEAAPTR